LIALNAGFAGMSARQTATSFNRSSAQNWRPDESVVTLGATLGITCLVATALLASVNAVTEGRIKRQAETELMDCLKEVMPEGEQFVPVTVNGETFYYKVISADGRLVGAAFKASAKGYSSIIDTIVGMNKDGKINAIKVISHQETPGLGSRITEIPNTLSIWDF